MPQKISWQPWSKEAFEKARRESKLVLLDIHGMWCHWCHVMEDTTYSDPEVIRKVNESYVAVKVDTDRRPDINERYNQGGWPTTAFLDPEGNLLTGGTYLQPRQMLHALHLVEEDYRKGMLKGYSHRQEGIEHSRLEGEIAGYVLGVILNYYDESFGGIGFEQKFPMTDTLQLLLSEYAKTKNSKYLEMVENTVNHMLAGIYDKEAGGFFRYSVTRDWKTPHYEKMLETNADMISLLCRLHRITKKEAYLEAAEKTVRYVLGTLSSKSGGFYGSQDADGEHEFYGLPLEERKRKEQPYVDKTIYAELNGAAISAFIDYYSIKKDREVKGFILETVEFLLEKMHTPEGFCHYSAGKEKENLGLLLDNVSMGQALIDAYNAFDNAEHLKKAEEVVKFIIKNFWDGKSGGFFDRMERPDDVGRLKARMKKIKENTRAARFLLGLSKATNKPAYREKARKCLELFAGSYQSYSFHAAEYACVVREFLAADRL